MKPRSTDSVYRPSPQRAQSSTAISSPTRGLVQTHADGALHEVVRQRGHAQFLECPDGLGGVAAAEVFGDDVRRATLVLREALLAAQHRAPRATGVDGIGASSSSRSWVVLVGGVRRGRLVVVRIPVAAAANVGRGCCGARRGRGRTQARAIARAAAVARARASRAQAPISARRAPAARAAPGVCVPAVKRAALRARTADPGRARALPLPWCGAGPAVGVRAGPVPRLSRSCSARSNTARCSATSSLPEYMAAGERAARDPPAGAIRAHAAAPPEARRVAPARRPPARGAGPRACARVGPELPTPVPRPHSPHPLSPRPATRQRVDAHRRAADPFPPCPSVPLSLSFPLSPAQRIPPHTHKHTHAPQPPGAHAHERHRRPRPSPSPLVLASLPRARGVARARTRAPRRAAPPHFAARALKPPRAAPSERTRAAFRAARFATAPAGKTARRHARARARAWRGRPRAPPTSNPKKPKRMRSDAPLAASVDPNTLQNPNAPARPPMRSRRGAHARARGIRVCVYVGLLKKRRGHFERDLGGVGFGWGCGPLGGSEGAPARVSGRSRSSRAHARAPLSPFPSSPSSRRRRAAVGAFPPPRGLDHHPLGGWAAGARARARVDEARGDARRPHGTGWVGRGRATAAARAPARGRWGGLAPAGPAEDTGRRSAPALPQQRRGAARRRARAGGAQRARARARDTGGTGSV